MQANYKYKEVDAAINIKTIVLPERNYTLQTIKWSTHEDIKIVSVYETINRVSKHEGKTNGA